MEGKAFIIVVLSGLCFLPACFPKSYIIVEMVMSWSDARSYCRTKYTDLAKVDNEEESKLLAATNKFNIHYLWIGLYDDINSWRWSLQEEGFYSAGGAGFRKWKAGKPDNYYGYEDCVEMLSDGSWDDYNCSNALPFVCYNATSSSFIFVDESKTWSEAQSYCREQDTDLASVRNQSENQQIHMVTQNQSAWIGLYRDGWKWSDGSPVTFTKWASAPSGNSPCVFLHEGYWVIGPCSTGYYFVCYIAPVTKQVVKVKLITNGSPVQLEDAAGAFLQQFYQTLQDQGLGGGIKLTWRKQPDGKIFHLEEQEEEEEVSCNMN